jgi:hypothetical protein
MAALPRCTDAPGLERWVRTALAPYYTTAPDDVLVPGALTDIKSDVPILEDARGASCVWSGRLGAIAVWQAHDRNGAIVARAATAPTHELLVPRTIVEKHPCAYHQSAIGSGALFNGYILGDDLVGILNFERGQRLLFLVAEFADAAVEDYSGYWQGEHILERLLLR